MLHETHDHRETLLFYLFSFPVSSWQQSNRTGDFRPMTESTVISHFRGPLLLGRHRGPMYDALHEPLNTRKAPPCERAILSLKLDTKIQATSESRRHQGASRSCKRI